MCSAAVVFRLWEPQGEVCPLKQLVKGATPSNQWWRPLAEERVVLMCGSSVHRQGDAP